MTAHTGPPEERGGAPTGSARHHQRQSLAKEDQHPQFNRLGRRCGRHADAWRWGFGCGFRDALRLAARQLPPETWDTLEALADQYELASE